jgi:hypothetical protein
MENPEKLATRRGNREWKIQRNWQYWVHKPQDKDKPVSLDCPLLIAPSVLFNVYLKKFLKIPKG